MGVNDQRAHVEGNKHRKRVGAKKAPATPSPLSLLQKSKSPSVPTAGKPTSTSNASASAASPKKVTKWKCGVCDTKKMHPNSRASHEAGRRHRAKAAIMARSIAPKSKTSPTVVTSLIRATSSAKSTQNSSKAWTCTVCNRSMDIDSRIPHQKGKKHVRAAARAGSGSHITPVITAPPARATSKVSGNWACAFCSIILHVNDRRLHEAGKKHKSQVASRQGPNTSLSKQIACAPSSWTCDVCNRKMHKHNRVSHEQGKKHSRKAQGAQQWTCNVCQITMDPNCRGPHERGKKHVRNTASRPQGASITAPSAIPLVSTQATLTKTPEVTAEWTCDFCCISVEPSHRSAHEETETHCQAVRLSESEGTTLPLVPTSIAPVVVLESDKSSHTAIEGSGEVSSPIDGPPMISCVISASPDDYAHPSEDGSAVQGEESGGSENKAPIDDWDSSDDWLDEEIEAIIHDIHLASNLLPDDGAYIERNFYNEGQYVWIE
ncbi:hypothetical protein DL93DRAFT_2231230 [Clavulina sp. PMI_390]|nr:hypothetical protein DL93DRAFT_2231230 [Clavulina sp. PMI_390]